MKLESAKEPKKNLYGRTQIATEFQEYVELCLEELYNHVLVKLNDFVL